MTSNQHSVLAEKVRKGLNPRGHHRLCRVNMPTEWSSECNCPHDEVEDGHAALDSLEEQLETYRDAESSLMLDHLQEQLEAEERNVIQFTNRLNAAEQDNKRLLEQLEAAREALEQIASWSYVEPRGVALKALASFPAPESPSLREQYEVVTFELAARDSEVEGLRGAYHMLEEQLETLRGVLSGYHGVRIGVPGDPHRTYVYDAEMVDAALGVSFPAKGHPMLGVSEMHSDAHSPASSHNVVRRPLDKRPEPAAWYQHEDSDPASEPKEGA